MNQHKVHFVYLVPSDIEPVAEKAIKNTALHLQSYYQWQMGNQKTFMLNAPIETYSTDHNALWYSTNNSGSDSKYWYWDNGLAEASRYAGANWDSLFDSWVVYLDAPIAPGQAAGGTSANGISGICLLTGDDCAGVNSSTPCRWIGGCGHELGHTFNLPDTPQGLYRRTSLMGLGYQTYPSDCILIDSDKTILNANPFFAPEHRFIQPHGLCPFIFSPRPPPKPKPRPVPPPRP